MYWQSCSKEYWKRVQYRKLRLKGRQTWRKNDATPVHSLMGRVWHLNATSPSQALLQFKLVSSKLRGKLTFQTPVLRSRIQIPKIAFQDALSVAGAHTCPSIKNRLGYVLEKQGEKTNSIYSDFRKDVCLCRCRIKYKRRSMRDQVFLQWSVHSIGKIGGAARITNLGYLGEYPR